MAALRAALYARVSTSNKDQDPEVQLLELRPYVERRGWALAGEFVDEGISGAREARPGLDALMKAARRRQIDVIVVWALDRFGRSLRHLVMAIDELASLSVGFVAFTQGIDTTRSNPASTLTLQVLGAVAEFERAMLGDRVRAGLAKARASGARIGRPCAALDLERARALRARGLSWREAARRLRTNTATLRRALARGA
jgi:DNA invertase Pin-like site-specific DNA recombinase